jgi:hypothetical protein
VGISKSYICSSFSSKFGSDFFSSYCAIPFSKRSVFQNPSGVEKPGPLRGFKKHSFLKMELHNNY